MNVWADPRVQGAARLAVGAGEVAIGSYLMGTTLGVPLGYVGIAHGLDQICTGFNMLYSGEKTDTLTSQSLQYAGLSASTANRIDNTITSLVYLGGVYAWRAGLAAVRAGYAAYQTTGSLATYESSVLVPLGRGSTGRSMPNNLREQMAMKEIMSDPQKGDIIIEKIKDSRWQNWDKMQWMDKRTGIEIHYVGKHDDGILRAVDDFKFIDRRMPK